MKKKLISMILIGVSLTFMGCSQDGKLVDNKVSLSSSKEVSDDGNYVVVVELDEGIKDVDYTLTENGQLISSQEQVDEGLKENIISNKAKGEYEYVLTVKDNNGNTVTKELLVKVGDSLAASAKVSDDNVVEWSGNAVEYIKGDNVKYEEKNYECLQGHTSQEDWNPVSAISLWREIKY